MQKNLIKKMLERVNFKIKSHNLVNCNKVGPKQFEIFALSSPAVWSPPHSIWFARNLEMKKKMIRDDCLTRLEFQST